MLKIVEATVRDFAVKGVNIPVGLCVEIPAQTNAPKDVVSPVLQNVVEVAA